MSVRVKIEGITSVADAKAAIRYGADAIGLVFAKSDPPCARVWLDGVETDWVTPRLLRDVAAGRHVVRLAVEGYESSQHEFVVEAGRIVKLDVRLSEASPSPANGVRCASGEDGSTARAARARAVVGRRPAAWMR